MKVKPFLWLVEVKDPLKIKYPFVTAFGLTDEVFAMSLNANDEKYIWGLEVGAYLSWILGTLLGIVGGAILLSCNVPSLTFSLTALFLILLIPNLRGYHAFAGVVGGAIALLFHLVGYTSMGILLAGILSPIVVLKVRTCLSGT